MALSRNCRTWATRSNMARVWNTWRCAIKTLNENIRIDRLDPRFSETALREYYHKLHRMPTEMQQEYRQENAPAKPKWQPTELQSIVRRARYLGKLPRRYPKVSGFMACYYHYCALLRKSTTARAQSAATFCCVRIFCCSADTSSRQNSYGKNY